jgi:hypothetical protein
MAVPAALVALGFGESQPATRGTGPPDIHPSAGSNWHCGLLDFCAHSGGNPNQVGDSILRRYSYFQHTGHPHDRVQAYPAAFTRPEGCRRPPEQRVHLHRWHHRRVCYHLLGRDTHYGCPDRPREPASSALVARCNDLDLRELAFPCLFRTT